MPAMFLPLRIVLLAWFAALARPAAADASGAPHIAGIAVQGAPVRVFDHRRDQQEPDNVPDAQITAWREIDGTVNLMIPNREAYRMRGPDLDHLRIDAHKIFSSAAEAGRIREEEYDYHHWFLGPYSFDGRRFYTLSHTEWYACLLNADCSRTSADGGTAEIDGWANTVNSFVSPDGGASWRLNASHGNHVVAKAAHRWTGSKALARRIYLHADNHTGMFQPSRIVKEGRYFYSVAYYIHRDFRRIEAGDPAFAAPVDRSGYVLLRTPDLADANAWEAWNGGDRFAPADRSTFETFQPRRDGATLDAAPAELIYDVNARCYILMSTLFGGRNAVFYATTKSLANPSWSDYRPIAGTAELVTGSASAAARGFNDANYPSLIDPDSEGFNFEFTHGRPLLFYITEAGPGDSGRDVYKIRLSIKYVH